MSAKSELLEGAETEFQGLKGAIAGPPNGFVQVCSARTPKIKKG